ncbi:MAG: transcriptional activator HlyU [Rhodospirillales bacterium]|nr:transcriptional activator HlyU [Rhodospirillales bacterium]
MASFFSKLFGGGSAADRATPEPGDPVVHAGLVIRAAPEPEGSQFRLAGLIIKETDTGPLQRHFVRADVFADHAEAVDFTIRKGRQIIDEQGDRLFADGQSSGRA